MFEERRARPQGSEGSSLLAILLVIGGVTYNCMLALLNARGMYVGRSLVVIAELIILSGVFLTVIRSRTHNSDALPALFFGVFLVSASMVSLFSGGMFIEMARNAAIIALFVMLGARISAPTLHKCFFIAAAPLFADLLIEIRSVESYGQIFSPASYFAQTRGLPPSEFDDYGIFGNALGWDERFSILRIIDHRAASLFLEQVSLANFAVVLTIFLCCRWKSLAPLAKILLIPLIALVVITTASRAAFGLVLAAPIAWLIAPKLNRFVPALVMPIILFIAFIVTQARPAVGEDNLEGRLGYTIRNLGKLDLPAVFGFDALRAPGFADSGYVYVIVGSSILGLLALWIFVSLIVVGRHDATKRCSLLLSLYVFANLTVSGTSIFSIKTAALLWLLVGFMREREHSLAAIAEQVPPSPLKDERAGLHTAARLGAGRSQRLAVGRR